MADCNVPLVAIPNDPCNKLGLGKQIPTLLYQDMAGVAPTLADLSAAQAAMTAAGADKLFILKNLAASDTPAAADQVLSGNDVPFGGQELTDRARTLTARVQYPTAATITAVNAVNNRGGLYRVWLVDDKGFPQGPIENVSLVFGSMVRPGLGNNLPVHFPLTASYNQIDEPAVGATAKPFLHKLENAA